MLWQPAILMDLSKAFYCILRDHSVAKPMSFGIGHQRVSLIGNYLSDRKQSLSKDGL